MPKKFLQQDAENIFKSYGCELLSEYKHSEIPVVYRCVCGNVSKIRLHKLRKGHKCQKCGAKKRAAARKFNYKYVKDYFNAHNCVLLSSKYDNCETPLAYKCSCGNVSKIAFGSFRQGHRCKKCSLRYGESNNKWNPNREEVRLSESFRKRCYNLLHRSLKATGEQKNRKTVALLGYTPKTLKEWIMHSSEWENIKNCKWHLDHIFPIRAFLDYGITDLKIINSLDNLRPVCAIDNLKKQGKYSKQEFEFWLKSTDYDNKK